jgi:nucleoside-diphosphate-sugar epimerase
VDRTGLIPFLADAAPAGHVINCIGLTGDFRTRPLETAEAHVAIVARCLAQLRFQTFLHLSSTRVYARAAATREDTPLPCLPSDPSDLYNLTKLAGEALCLSDPRLGVRVARLSNVYGGHLHADTFLGQIILAGLASGRVVLRQAPESEKDYISLDSVTSLLPAIAIAGRHRLYNVATGRNTSHRAIADILRRSLGWDVSFAPDAPLHRFRPIDITRLTEEFSPPLSNFSSDLPKLAAGQEAPCSPSTRLAVA